MSTNRLKGHKEQCFVPFVNWQSKAIERPREYFDNVITGSGSKNEGIRHEPYRR